MNDQLENALNKANLLKSQSELKYRSSNKLTKNSVYPWLNHDYDYQQFVKNNYTPEKMGISPEPCIDVTIKDGIRLPNYIKAAMFDAIPNIHSQAGRDDVDPKNKELKEIRSKYQNFTEPYPGFMKEYPEYFPHGIQGEFASSYFLHTGYCPTKITSKSECDKKGYTWIPNPIKLPEALVKFFPEAETINNFGGCQKPRYSYVNNQSGDITGMMKGIVPTIGKNVLDLNPVSFLSIFMTGSSPNGDFQPLPCREGFTNKPEMTMSTSMSKSKSKSKYCQGNYLFTILLIIIPLILIISQLLL